MGFDALNEDCRVTLRRAYLFLDGEVLSEEERLEISGHLERCRPCLERYGLEKEVSTIVARLKGAEPCPENVRLSVNRLLEL